MNAILTFAVTLVIVALGTAGIFWVSGADILGGFAALAQGAFGSEHAIWETLTRATPVMLTGAAVSVAFRAKIWSIGAEGQLFAGAVAGYGIIRAFPDLGWFSIPCILVAGFIGGAGYATLAALLKTRRGVNEVISTVMLNYVALLFLSLLLLDGPWSDPGSAYAQSPTVPHDTEFPLLAAHSHLHIGLLIGFAACLAVQFLMARTSFGYDIRAFGLNPHAYAVKTGDADRLILKIMALSGGLAGLAGVGEVFGVHHRLFAGISPGGGYGYGYTGISLAMLMRLNPIGIAVGSILFGGIVSAAIKMQILAGVPSAASPLIQAVILLAVLASGAIVRRFHVE